MSFVVRIWEAGISQTAAADEAQVQMMHGTGRKQKEGGTHGYRTGSLEQTVRHLALELRRHGEVFNQSVKRTPHIDLCSVRTKGFISN